MTTPPEARFIQIHTLTSFAGVLLNRDETGAAKRMPYGGTVRTRISSQCLKRHWRTNAGEWQLEKDAQKSLRTRQLFEKELHTTIKADTGAADELVKAVGEAITLMLYGKNDVKERQVMLFGRAEIEAFKKFSISLVNEAQTDKLDAKSAQKFAKEKLKEQKLSAIAKDASKLPAGLIAALFGRMVTSDPEANIDAAIHVAHAFTVHKEESEGDYFTVVDDLSEAMGEAGAGGIFDTEITSGLFYSYVVIDVPALVSNLTGKETSAALSDGTDRTLSAEIVKRLVHLIATVSPGAKKGSTAPYAYADLMMIEAGERQPRSLAAAFREPVAAKQDQSQVEAAIQALASQLKSFDKAYGEHESRRLMNATTVNTETFVQALNLEKIGSTCACGTDQFEPFDAVQSLEDIAKWTAKVVREGKA